MAINAQNAWRNAEQRLFEYLETVLGGERGVTAYSPDDGLPRKANAVEDLEMWTFEMQGGGEARRQQTKPMQGWQMGCTFRGIFTTRERAQRIAGLIMDQTPVSSADTITGVLYFTIAANPIMQCSVAQLANDLTEGGEVRVFTLEIPMEAAFTNTIDQ